MYQNWLFKIVDQEQRNYFAKITREDFQRALLSVDCERRGSICKSDNFMQKFNIDLTNINIIHNTRIRFYFKFNIFLFDEIKNNNFFIDVRIIFFEIIFEIYVDKVLYKTNKLNNENYSLKKIIKRTLKLQTLFECFYQLNNLKYYNVDKITKLQNYDNWHKFNYVFVKNVYNDFI